MLIFKTHDGYTMSKPRLGRIASVVYKFIVYDGLYIYYFQTMEMHIKSSSIERQHGRYQQYLMNNEFIICNQSNMTQ